MEADGRIVLLVEHDADRRERFGGWLTDAGYDVLACPGPSAPDYVCLGGTGRTCPLAAGADAVVLDLLLGSDEVMMGTPGRQLLSFYAAQGLPVVAMVDDAERRYPVAELGSPWVGRHPRKEDLLDALQAALARADRRRRT